VTDEELVERLMKFADNPKVGAHNRIRAIEVVHRIQRDGRRESEDAIDQVVQKILREAA
jgi:hypothetical protein